MARESKPPGRVNKDMAQETEIKLRVATPKVFLRKLKTLGAAPDSRGPGRVHEWNTIFDTPEGGLAKHGQLLRIRTETPAAGKKKSSRTKTGALRHVLTFKRPVATPARAAGNLPSPAGIHKVREEIEMEIAAPDILARIFEGLGMRGWFHYEKYRTTFRLPAAKRWAEGLLIELDETPVGVFAELEGPAGAIDRAAELLGYTRRDYVTRNYLSLYIEECRRRGQEPRDMTFATLQ